jgi:hypothetical protein
MKSYLTTPSSFGSSDAPTHFETGSALREFMAGRLGAPSCWPDENRRTSTFLRLPDEVSSIQRWENEGGKAFAPAFQTRGQGPARQLFHPSRSFLTQLI